MPASERLTQRELARKLGVSQATVSRSLAGHPRQADATCVRVRQEAEQAGYRPDPVLASLNAYRRTRRPISQGQALAWFGDLPLKQSVYENTLVQMAQSRAERLGYRLEHFLASEPGFTPDRFEKIFSARGIAGVIFGPRQQPHARIELPIDRFSAVALGRSIQWPPVDLVSTDHFQTMQLCCQELRALGYRRIGFALNQRYHERVAGLWSGAFLTQQLRQPKTHSIPPLLDDLRQTGPFARWFERWKPDAIVTMGRSIGCVPALQKLGVKIPQEVGVALLVVLPGERGYAHFAGVNEPLEALARFAVDVLIGRIRHNETGIPEDRRIHLLPGTWKMGSTVKRLSQFIAL